MGTKCHRPPRRAASEQASRGGSAMNNQLVQETVSTPGGSVPGCWWSGPGTTPRWETLWGRAVGSDRGRWEAPGGGGGAQAHLQAPWWAPGVSSEQNGHQIEFNFLIIPWDTILGQINISGHPFPLPWSSSNWYQSSQLQDRWGSKESVGKNYSARQVRRIRQTEAIIVINKITPNAEPKAQAGEAYKGPPQVLPPSCGQGSRRPPTREMTVTSRQRVPHKAACSGAAPVSCFQTPRNKGHMAAEAQGHFSLEYLLV